MKLGGNFKVGEIMRHKFFYLYQLADVIFTSSCRAIGILLAWVMIQHYQLKIELGWFITGAWFSQVIVLIFMGWFSDRFEKITIPIVCSFLSFIGLIVLELSGSISAIGLGSIYVISALLCIAIQPIGSSIIPNLFSHENIEKAFRIRGFVNSINTVLGAMISGFIINYFTTEQTIKILTATVGTAFILFMMVKTKENILASGDFEGSFALKALLNNKIERVLVVVSALSNFVLTPTLMYITPILVIEKYKYTAFEIGISEAVFGLGMLIGSLFLCGAFNKKFDIRLTTILSILSVVLGLLSILILNHIFALFLGLLFTGIGVVMYNINTTKIRCLATPTHLRISFESLFLAVCIIPIPVGVAVSTLLVESGKLDLSLALFSLLIFFSAIVIWQLKDFVILTNLDDQEIENYYVKLYPDAYPNKA